MTNLPIQIRKSMAQTVWSTNWWGRIRFWRRIQFMILMVN